MLGLEGFYCTEPARQLKCRIERCLVGQTKSADLVLVCPCMDFEDLLETDYLAGECALATWDERIR